MRVGVLDDKFYKWPLYQWLPNDGERGGDMMVDFHTNSSTVKLITNAHLLSFNYPNKY